MKFKINPYLIHHGKGVDLEITDFEYHHDPTPSGEIIPSQTSRYVIRGYYFIIRDGVEYPTSGASQKSEARRAKQ